MSKLALFACGYTDKNYVVNAHGIWTIWNIAKSFLPQYAIRKVVFL